MLIKRGGGKKVTRPNILIFMTDQERSDVTYADHPCQTPNLDRMAAAGLRFSNMFTTMAHCCPSRASFFTGLYPSQHGVYNNVDGAPALNRGLNKGIVTFPEKLKEAGYGLYFIGKWHVSSVEGAGERGWEELVVPRHKKPRESRNLKEIWSDRQKFGESGTARVPGELQRRGWSNKQLYGAKGELEGLHDYLLVEQGVRQIEQLRDSPDPWCLYLGMKGPHDPFIIPEKYANMYNPAEVELPASYADSLLDKPGVYRRQRRIWDQLTSWEVKEATAHYWGYCTMMDDLFGKVIESLEQTNQVDNTLVIFLSDHGENLGAHGLFYKGVSPYDETYRIPCILRWPNGIKHPGRDVQALTSIMDFTPTLLELAGAGCQESSKGRSLTPWMNGDTPAVWRDAVFNQCNGVEIYHTQRFVRTDKYKFVFNPTDIDELYDLHRDPHEMFNLAERPEMQEIKSQLYIRMWEEASEVDDPILDPGASAIPTADYGPALALGKGPK